LIAAGRLTPAGKIAESKRLQRISTGKLYNLKATISAKKAFI
jgi:hypothetical protein